MGVFGIMRVPLHDQVVDHLRQMLVEGHIRPGKKLNERELCAQLGVSRTPLREAIKLLAAEGLVELLPNRGAVAARLDEGDLITTFEVLAELEAFSGELAAMRITDLEIEEIRALHHEMMACFAARDRSGYFEANAKIHKAINRAAKNPLLTDLYRTVNGRTQLVRFNSNLDEANWKRAVREHEQILEALVARDPARVRALLKTHLSKRGKRVVELVRNGEPKELVAG